MRRKLHVCENHQSCNVPSVPVPLLTKLLRHCDGVVTSLLLPDESPSLQFEKPGNFLQAVVARCLSTATGTIAISLGQLG
jgi:hypothetical protein